MHISKTLRNLSNIPGWNTRRKLVVFESDDWGSIRTSSIEDVEDLVSMGIDFTSIDARRYSYNDMLASEKDLSGLFEVLGSAKDSNNHPAVFTAVSLLANPDFEAIRASGFRNYMYEPFTRTLERTPGCEHSFKLWIKGIEEGIFIPQFHGREHLNISSWMHALRGNHAETVEVFNRKMWGYVNAFYDSREINYQEAFNIHDPEEVHSLELVIADGLRLFEELFGFRARLFVPPNGPFSNKLEKCLAENGVDLINQSKIQIEPVGFGRHRKVLHYLGQRNRFGQIYLTRNAFFEPNSPDKSDWIDACLAEIQTAFRWHKPAIVTTHRVNYIGGLNEDNRSNGLRQLGELLRRIKKYWPEVEFISSDQLGDLIIESRKR